MASAPATKYRPRSRPPHRDGVHCDRPTSTRLEPVPRLRGFDHWFTLVHLPVSLAGPGPSGGADPSRRCRGCSHPPLRSPGSGCPQLQRPAATGRRWSLSSHSITSAPRGALRARSTTRASRRGGQKRQARARSASSKTACPPAFSQKAPVPGDPNLGPEPDSNPPRMIFMPRPALVRRRALTTLAFQGRSRSLCADRSALLAVVLSRAGEGSRGGHPLSAQRARAGPIRRSARQRGWHSICRPRSAQYPDTEEMPTAGLDPLTQAILCLGGLVPPGADPGVVLLGEAAASYL